MAKSEIHYIQGPCMYAKVFEHNRDLKGYEDSYVEHDGMYTIMVGVDKKSDAYKRIMSWNSNYEPRIGGTEKLPLDKGAVKDLAYFTFKRKHSFIISRGERKGETIADFGGSPKVLTLEDTSDKPSTLVDFPANTLIGNGSLVTVKLDVYPVNNRLSMVRLESVLVEKLEEISQEELEKAGGKKYDLDDDIPF